MTIGRSACSSAALLVGALTTAIISHAASAADDPSIFSQFQVEEAEYRYTDDDEESFNWKRALGDAADELEDEGETIDSFAGVAGIRFWF